jgi:single-strand DNA-binding protein
MHNSVNLIGRIGQDPKEKTFSDGNSITSFSLATSDGYKNKEGEYIEQTDWHNVVIKGRSAANAAKLLKKGSLTHIQGKVKTRSYETQDGGTKYVTEIVAFGFNLLEKKDDVSQPSGGRSQTNFQKDDMPF